MRTATRRRALSVPLAAAAALALLAGCGEAADDGSVSTNPGSGDSVTTTPSESAQAATELTIVHDDGAGQTQTWTLTCDPAGGDHPDPAGACAALAENGATSLPPVPKDRMCTQIFGGPETVTITGTFQGQEVSSKLSKGNGCEIARWKSLSALVPGGGTGST